MQLVHTIQTSDKQVSIENKIKFWGRFVQRQQGAQLRKAQVVFYVILYIVLCFPAHLTSIIKVNCLIEAVTQSPDLKPNTKFTKSNVNSLDSTVCALQGWRRISQQYERLVLLLHQSSLLEAQEPSSQEWCCWSQVAGTWPESFVPHFAG